ncbi:ArnT family glycosyltransferase [Haloplanus aerogenes]|uniref:Dolichyl-phosphate-mannose-protein mannosyltransferase n=1 Tax=Haloplanus aerogenes TaxID=660522 RepID=A0A3M0CTC8_9EURY|nr:glycosyltransferase family 39 protein [Haloplanus aerogenes]AZH26500.1 hypothetical protein DU502_14470 [Haloplanus aerogenes]RMB12728.1 dolichyl-phosphate-mannose-protein mannosyltransferase [Haloplanus aerogenes]
MVSEGWSQSVKSVIDRLRTPFVDAPTGVVFVVATAVVFYRLGERPLWWWDESFYANAARHAVEQGHWLVPHLAGFDTIHASPFLEKPPLAIWLEALSIGVFGPTEFAVRLPSATAAVGVTVLVYVLGRRLYGPAAGLVAAAVFLTTPAVLVGTNAARFGATDMLHVFFGSLLVALVWFHATERYDASPVLVGAVAAALLLTKGFAGGVFFLALLPLPLVYRDRFSPRFVGIAAAITVVAVGSWVGAVYLRVGDLFVEEIFLEPVWQRIVGTDTPSTGRQTLVPIFEYPYPTELQSLFRPWWFLFLASVGAAAVSFRSDGIESATPGFLLWWTAAAAGPFAFFGTKTWYILPMYAPAAITVGWLVATALDGYRPSAVGVVVGTVLAVVAGSDGRLYGPGGLVDGPLAPDWTVATAVTLVCLGGWLLTTDVLDRGSLSLPGGVSLDVRSLARGLTVGAVLVFVVSALVGAPSVYAAGFGDEPTDTEFRRLGERTADVVPADERVYVQPNAAAVWFYSSYQFYADRPMQKVSVERLRTDPQIRYAVLTTSGVAVVNDRNPTVVAESSHLDIALVELDSPEDT